MIELRYENVLVNKYNGVTCSNKFTRPSRVAPPPPHHEVCLDHSQLPQQAITVATRIQ
jgi:hypothetical protein